jgi:CRP/FNR family transcriptional activator FtrB
LIHVNAEIAVLRKMPARRHAVRQFELAEMRGLRIFSGVADAQVEAMLKGAFLQRFPPFVELAREGEPADFLHVVVEGQVEIFAEYRDRETTIAVQGPGHAFIIAAVILDRVYLKSARALTAARILMIPAEAVRQAFAADAAFCRSLSGELALAYRMVVKELKNQKLRTSLERVANWLLAQDTANGGAGRFVLPFDKKILASRLGIVPEVLSRSFTALVPYGVRVSGPEVTIKDRKALMSLARPSATIDDPAT